jgi:hypothetical protein
MTMHTVQKGDLIKSNIHSRIWIDIGETFTVEEIVVSQITGDTGVMFLDRTGSQRVFWNPHDYELIRR